MPTTRPDAAHRVRGIKTARTRAALVDAAVDLCLRQGYENTTVEHIATAAAVSPRTFSRYFRSKDAVFVSLLDDLADDVSRELRALESGLGPLESMRVALGAVLNRAHDDGVDEGSDRITRIISVVTASNALRQAAVEYRGPQVVEAMAQRMNVAVDDRRLALAMVIISVTVVQAWTDLAQSGEPLAPPVIAAQIDRVFADLSTYAADLDPS